MKFLLICNYKPGVGGISGQVEILQRKLRSEGHTADIFSTKASVLKRLLLPIQLRSAAKHYDVLHIHCCSGWGFLPAMVGVTVGRRLKKRVVLTYHGGGGEHFFDKHTCLVKHYLTRTDANIVLSGFLAKVFDNHHLPYNVIPNIIVLDESHYRERKEIKPHFICIRSHEPLYNIPCILRAFQKVMTEIPEATLTLVGTGSQHEALIAMAQEMGLKNVSFTGRVDNSEIYLHLDKADIMLSAPTVDNMPVSVLEAMNAGLLVISSNVGGVPYMVDDNKTGYLFPSDDSDALASLMIQAVQLPYEKLSIIRNAHQAVNVYHWDNIKDKLYHTYGFSS
ncbi:MAG: glycosyltransferase family 4 protein [Bacteroidales bacterium]|nr:glycosyltransferase family 4 protein [Bacteroidales bacterium]